MTEVSNRVPRSVATARTGSGFKVVSNTEIRGYHRRLAGVLCVGLLIALNVVVAREALVIGWVPFVITILIGGTFCVPLFAVSCQTRGPAQNSNHFDRTLVQGLEPSPEPTSPMAISSTPLAVLGPQLADDVYIELEWRAQTTDQAALPADISLRVGELLELFALLTVDNNALEPLRVDQALVVLRKMPASLGCDLRIIAALEAVLIGRQAQTYPTSMDLKSDRDRRIATFTC